jgi:hypothetical protein
MAEFVNLQIYGVPVVTYGLVGITTAVLAYTTYISNVGETVATSTESIVGNPMEALNSMNPLSSEEKEATPTAEEPSPIPESLNPFASQEATKGGKKLRRKTPKSKRKRGGKSKTTKHK